MITYETEWQANTDYVADVVCPVIISPDVEGLDLFQFKAKLSSQDPREVEYSVNRIILYMLRMRERRVAESLLAGLPKMGLAELPGGLPTIVSRAVDDEGVRETVGTIARARHRNEYIWGNYVVAVGGCLTYRDKPTLTVQVDDSFVVVSYSEGVDYTKAFGGVVEVPS